MSAYLVPELASGCQHSSSTCIHSPNQAHSSAAARLTATAAAAAATAVAAAAAAAAASAADDTAAGRTGAAGRTAAVAAPFVVGTAVAAPFVVGAGDEDNSGEGRTHHRRNLHRPGRLGEPKAQSRYSE